MNKPFLLSKKEPSRKKFSELSEEEQKSLWAGGCIIDSSQCGFPDEGVCEEYQCFDVDPNDPSQGEYCDYFAVLD